MTWPELKRIPQLTLFLFLMLFLTTRLGTLIHEALGHGLACVLMGGQVLGMSIHLFATGSCDYQLPNSHLMGRALVDMAGIFVNLLLGLLALIALKQKTLRLELRAFLSVFAIISIGSQLTYLVMGTYYGYEDPKILAELLGPRKWIVWMGSLALMAPSTYFLAHGFLRLQEEMFPSKTLKARAVIMFSTLIAASVLYGVCFHAEGRVTGFAGGMVAHEERIQLQAEKAVEGELLPDDEKKRRIEAIKKELRPVPIIIPILLITFFSGLFAFLKTKDWPTAPERRHISRASMWWSLWAALVVGGLIVLVY